jgi:hypothetical protein
MKKLFKRNVYVMLAAVALVTAVLVTNCISPINGGVQEEEDNFIPFDPPAGKGYIRIKVANDARTIMPTLPDVNELYYHVVVTDEDGSALAPTNYDSNTINSGLPVDKDTLAANPIVLDPADYTVVVTAYTAANVSTIVGTGTNTGVNVASGSGGSTIVSLKPYTSGGDGTFAYEIQLPSNLSSANSNHHATLDVVAYPGKGTIPAFADVNLFDDPDNGTGATLAAGFYYVIVTLTDDSELLQNRTITNILQIYQNMTSTYAPDDALPALNRFKYTLNFDNNDKVPANTSTVTASPGNPWKHGTPVTKLGTDPTHYSADPEWVFKGWFKTRGTAPADEWNFTSGLIIDDLVLYAGWLNAKQFALTINWENPTLPTLSSPPTGTLTNAGYYNGSYVSATFSVINLNGYTVQGWMHDGGTGAVFILGTEDEQDLVLSNDPTLTDVSYLSKGIHTFTVVLQKLDGLNVEDVQNFNFTLTVN